MGREIKRVAVDFDAPLRKVWAGYIMPAELQLPDCPDCNGTGETAASKWIRSITQLMLMVGDDLAAQERGRELHPYLAHLQNAPYEHVGGGFVTRRPGPDALEFTTALTGGTPDRIFGYSSTDTWGAVKKIIEALGLPETWGTCPTCGGDGSSATAEQRAAHEAWECTEPPEGDAYQMWETVSEGSPISPPFAVAEDLALWMTQNKCTVAGPFSSVEAAMRFIDAGWAPSFIGTPETGLVDGATFAGMERSHE